MAIFDNPIFLAIIAVCFIGGLIFIKSKNKNDK